MSWLNKQFIKAAGEMDHIFGAKATNIANEVDNVVGGVISGIVGAYFMGPYGAYIGAMGHKTVDDTRDYWIARSRGTPANTAFRKAYQSEVASAATLALTYGVSEGMTGTPEFGYQSTFGQTAPAAEPNVIGGTANSAEGTGPGGFGESVTGTESTTAVGDASGGTQGAAGTGSASATTRAGGTVTSNPGTANSDYPGQYPLSHSATSAPASSASPSGSSSLMGKASDAYDFLSSPGGAAALAALGKGIESLNTKSAGENQRDILNANQGAAGRGLMVTGNTGNTGMTVRALTPQQYLQNAGFNNPFDTRNPSGLMQQQSPVQQQQQQQQKPAPGGG